MTIHQLVKDGSDLYVLKYEGGLRVEFYPRGAAILRSALSKCFGRDLKIQGPIINEGGLENYFLRTAIEEGAVRRIFARSETPRFIDSLVNDYYLRAFPEVDTWSEYRERMGNSHAYGCPESRRRSRKVLNLIRAQPDLFGFPVGHLGVSEEIKLKNTLASPTAAFKKKKERREDLKRRYTIGQIDAAVCYEEIDYIVEIKTGNGSTVPKKMHKQLAIAAALLERNFDWNFRYVGIKYRDSQGWDDIKIITYEYEKGRLELESETDWFSS